MCNWFNSKPKDLDGKIVPEYGICVFAWDDDLYKIMDLKPQWIRMATDTGVNFNDCINKIRYFRNRGVRILLCLQDKNNQYNTPALCKRYADNLKDDVWYEIMNEPNINIDHFIKPEEYVKIFNEAIDKIKRVNSNAKVIMGGLAGDVRHNDSDAILATDYIRRFINAGGETDAWNIHQYEISKRFYETRDLIRRLDKNKPFIVGEYGTDNPNETVKIADYDFKMNKFTKNYVSAAYIYAWCGDPKWSVQQRPQFMEYMKDHWRR